MRGRTGSGRCMQRRGGRGRAAEGGYDGTTRPQRQGSATRNGIRHPRSCRSRCPPTSLRSRQWWRPEKQFPSQNTLRHLVEKQLEEVFSLPNRTSLKAYQRSVRNARENSPLCNSVIGIRCRTATLAISSPSIPPGTFSNYYDFYYAVSTFLVRKGKKFDYVNETAGPLMRPSLATTDFVRTL